MIRLCLILLLSPLILFSKTWTNSSGKSFSGELQCFSPEDVKIKRTSDGQIFTVKRSELSNQDEIFLKDLINKEYSKSKDFDRKKIPSFDQSDFRGGSSSCSPSSMMNFIVWWSDHYDEFHRGGNYKQNVKKIQRTLVNYTKSSGGGASFEDIVEALEKYFSRYVEGFSFYYKIIYLPDLDQLKYYAQGSNAVILSTGWYQESGGKYKLNGLHATSLVGILNEKLYLNTWGRKYVLNLKETLNSRFPFRQNTLADWGLKHGRKLIELKHNSYSRAFGDICFVNRILVITPLEK